MKTQKLICLKVIEKTRKNNSIYGNPSFELCLCDENACKLYYFKTAYNSTAGYKAISLNKNEYIDIRYHETRAGYLIIDYIDKIWDCNENPMWQGGK